MRKTLSHTPRKRGMQTHNEADLQISSKTGPLPPEPSGATRQIPASSSNAAAADMRDGITEPPQPPLEHCRVHHGRRDLVVVADFFDRLVFG